MDSATTAARRAVWDFHEIVADAERVLDDTGGECTPDYDALMALADDTAAWALEQLKLARTELKAKAAANKALAEQYAKRAKRYEDQVDRLDGQALAVLRHTDSRSVQTSTGAVWIADGSERCETPTDQAGLKALAEAHPNLVRVKYEPKKREIAAEIKGGFEVEGCSIVRGDETVRFS